MVHAVRIPAYNAIFFVMGEPVTKPGWMVEPGAWLEVPSNTFYGFRGLDRPEPAICRAADDPLHYKIYMDPEQAEPDEWHDTGLGFGGTFSMAAWRELAPLLPEGEPVPSIAGAEEVAAQNEALRNLPRGF